MISVHLVREDLEVGGPETRGMDDLPNQGKTAKIRQAVSDDTDANPAHRETCSVSIHAMIFCFSFLSEVSSTEGGNLHVDEDI